MNTELRKNANNESDKDFFKLILHLSKKKEIFNELVEGRLEKIAELDERLSSDDLIYRYKGNTADSKFDEFDNVLDIINKIRDGKTDLADIKI